MFVAGVDENGLGPRLGPLVATAVTIEVATYRKAALRRLGERVGIHDSKATSGFGKMAIAEGVALALVERLHGQVPGDADALLDAVSLDSRAALRRPCPPRSARQCWSAKLPLPAFEGDVALGRSALGQLERRGVRVVAARSAVACAGVLNAEIKRLGSRARVDLSMFERLLAHAREQIPQDLTAHCGMVGGMRKYEQYFDHFAGRDIVCLGETRGRSGYRVDGIGELSFEVHADALHLPVGLASMLGKYVREVAMERQNRFYLAQQSSLPRASGYRDPVTRRFIEQSAGLRRRLGIAQSCFER